jgi:hypothetical protein
LGFEREGGTTVEGEAVDKINGLAGVRAEVRERLLEGIDRSTALGAAPDDSQHNRDIKRLKLALAVACVLAGLLLLFLFYAATAASP